MNSQEFKEISLLDSGEFFQTMNQTELCSEISAGQFSFAEETKEVKKDLNNYVNYNVLGGLEQILECDEDDA